MNRAERKQFQTQTRIPMPPSKKRKLATGDDDSLGNVSIDEEGGHDESMNNSEDDNRDVMSIEGSENSQSPHNSEMDSPDTEEEIAFSKMKKSKKTAKRKIRATSPTQFGSTLETLLGTSVPSSAPLALKPSIQRKRKNEKQDVVMRRTLESQKKEHEEMGRVTDVIGGWGGENERSLRKVAQRGGNNASASGINDTIDSLHLAQWYNFSMSFKRLRWQK